MHSRERGGGGYSQGAARRSLPSTKRRSSSFRREHNLFRMWQEGEAVLGQCRLPRGAMEEPGAESPLKGGEFGARASRRQTQVAGCGTDTVQLGDTHEESQIVHVHEMTFKSLLKLILKRRCYQKQS
jgi:hypothetical protein